MKKSLKLFGLVLLAVAVTFIGCNNDDEKVSNPTIKVSSIKSDRDGNFEVSLTVTCEHPDEVSEVAVQVLDQAGSNVLGSIAKSDMKTEGSGQKRTVIFTVTTPNAGWIKVTANSKNGGKSSPLTQKLENIDCTDCPVSDINLKVVQKGVMAYSNNNETYVTSFTITCAPGASIDTFSVQYTYNGKDSIMRYNKNLIPINKTSATAWQVEVNFPRYITDRSSGSPEYYGVEKILFIATASKGDATEEKEITVKTLKGADKYINEIRVGFVTGYKGDFTVIGKKIDTLWFSQAWGFYEIEKAERGAKFLLTMGKDKEGEVRKYDDLIAMEKAGVSKSKLYPRVEICAHAEEEVFGIYYEKANLRYFKNMAIAELRGDESGNYVPYDGGMADFHVCEPGRFTSGQFNALNSYVSITKFDLGRMVITGSAFGEMFSLDDWGLLVPNRQMDMAEKAKLIVEFIEVPLTVPADPWWASRIN